MNNLIDFAEYKRRVRLYEESLVTEQITKPLVEEGLFKGLRKKINDKAGVFVKKSLADEIEMGEKLQEEITKSIGELKDYVNKIQKEVDDSHAKNGDFFNKMQKIFKDIENASFSLMTLLGGVEINFTDFVRNAIMANMVNFGVLFIPTRNVFLLRKSYKYFIGIIKNTIRKDLLMLQLNFDQFENTVLIESLDEDEQRKWEEQYQTQLSVVSDLQKKILGEGDLRGIVKGKKTQDEIKKAIDNYKKTLDMQGKMQDRMNAAGYRMDAYGNTYTKTLEQLKNFVMEDDTKYLESLTKGMRELTIDEIDTKSYVELLIDAAEECAYEVSNAIHNNFLSMVSVFKLSNQKRLIELVKKDHEVLETKEREFEIKKREGLDTEKAEKIKKIYEEHGEEILDKVLGKSGDSAEDIVKRYEDLGDVEIDGEKYSEENILIGYLNTSENNMKKFPNWDNRKDDIPDLLKLHLDCVIPNIPDEREFDDFDDKGGYQKYIYLLTNCLMGCICESGKSYKIYVPEELKEKETTKASDGTEKTKETTYTKTEEKEVEESGFWGRRLDLSSSRVYLLQHSIYEEEKDSTLKNQKFVKDGSDGDEFVVDEDKEKLLEESLNILSKKCTKSLTGTDIKDLVEIIKNLFNSKDYFVKYGQIDTMKKKLNKIKTFSDNDFMESSSDDKESQEEKEKTR